MRSKSDDLLEQRVRTVLERFPDARANDSVLAFRVLLLYGASYHMKPDVIVGLPALADIITKKMEVQHV